MSENNLQKLQVLKAVADLNMIHSFKISEEEYANWTQTIFRLFKGTDPKILAETVGKVVDEYLFGTNNFVKDDGLLNIVTMVKRYLGIF